VIQLSNRETRADRNVGRRTRADARNLLLRTASAAVLAPLVLAVAYLGGWCFVVLCGLGAAGILWEWARLVAGNADLKILAPGLAALIAALAFAGVGQPGAATSAIAAGAALAGLVGIAGSAGRGGRARALWAVGGVLYAGAAFLGPALLRRDSELGFTAFLFVAASVWMTDICAYVVGRTVGGALLWPQLSPNKTWAGTIGGLLGGLAAGTVVAYANGVGRLAVVGVVALVLSVLAQAGDLLESAIKRHFGAKDTSQLIPGHGGLMDRLDGFLVAALAALLIGILRQGTNAPAHGLLVW
jgi:phosphatidate cytidylyltransferase